MVWRFAKHAIRSNISPIILFNVHAWPNMMGPNWEDNTMSTSMVWKATFKDGSVINQYDGERENLYRSVLDKVEDLCYLRLTHESRPVFVVVDLVQGYVFINQEPSSLSGSEDRLNIRPILFRRNTATFTGSGRLLDKKTIYFIGFQYNTPSGLNKKVELQIDQDGNILVGI